jgi:hypothetical protein
MHSLLVSIISATLVFTVTAADNQLTAEEKKAGWKLLFDGKSTDAWRSFKKQTFPDRGWTVENGILKLERNGKGGDIVSKETFSEFDLTWDWRIPPGANNGLKYFILEERGQATGHEYQMIDDKAIQSSPKHRTASFYDVLPPTEDAPLNPTGEWNHSRILVEGNRVEHWINGKKVLEYELGSKDVLKAVQNSKFKAVPGFGTKVKGHILLTDHHDPVEYKNIKIRDLIR